MRYLSLSALALIFTLAACSRQTESVPAGASLPKPGESAPAAQPAPAPENAQTLTLYVANLHCPTCERNVGGKLASLEGVVSAKADRGNGTATVTYDPAKVSTEALIAAVAEAPGMSGRPGQYSASLEPQAESH